jgi:hypothetical protein
MNKNLSNIFPEIWKDNYAKNLIDLVQSDYKELSEVEKDLRSLAVNLVQSFEREPIITPNDLLRNIQSYKIVVPKNKWFIFSITKDNNKYYIRTKGDKLKLSSAVFNFLPDTQTLSKKVIIPENGKIIILRGSGPEILENKKALDAFIDLKKNFNISDVAFYTEFDNKSIFYSVAAKTGKNGNIRISFPNESLINEWSL